MVPQNKNKRMTEKEELVTLAGQVVNGIMSSDESTWSKIIDRGIHSEIAGLAVNIAFEIQDKINKRFFRKAEAGQ